MIGLGIYFYYNKTLHIQIEGNLYGENAAFQANDVRLEKINSETESFVKARDFSTTY